MTDAAQLHADQVEYWNGSGGSRWIAQQARRDILLGEFGREVLAQAHARPGERVIDVGCGCGETSAVLAERVGPEGSVLAADVSAPILACAEARLAPFAWAKAVVADAATFPFDEGAADLLFSRFGVMFFGDPVAAFANLRRATKPGGRLVFACWRTPAENGWMTGPLEAVYRHVPRPPPMDPWAPGPFAFADPARVSRILVEAGFQLPIINKVDTQLDVAMHGGIDGAVSTALEFGPASRALDGQPDAVRSAAADSLRAYFAQRMIGGKIEQAAAIWIMSTAPA